METRSNHVLVGGVVLALLGLLLAFLIWLAGYAGVDDRPYDIFFKTSVAGLAKGSAVTFSGVPVGKVETIALMPNNPEFVRVRITVQKDVLILQGTSATIGGVGFTGVSQVNLDGSIRNAPPLTEEGPFGVPVIPTKPGALGELLNNAPMLIERLGTLTERVTELLDNNNQQSIRNTLRHVESFTGDLAKRGPEIAATLAETRMAVQQAGEAAKHVGELAATTNSLMARDVAPALANLKQASQSAQRTLETLDAAIQDARPGIKSFSTQTIPEANQLIRDLSNMTEAMNAIAARIDREGAGSVIGQPALPDYK